MADLNTKTFDELLEGEAAAVQANSAGLVDFSVGSIARAVSQAFAGVVLWLQGLILAVLAATRLATSNDDDADTFVADFGAPAADGEAPRFARLDATVAVGSLTFARITPSSTALIPIGATAETANGAQQFVVTADTTLPAYDATLNGYVIDIGTASLAVPAAAVTPGAAGNAAPGAVNTITSAISGVDTVTNPDAFIGGADRETTTAMRVRFPGFIQSLREATPPAIKYHVEAIQPGVSALVVPNQELSGVARKGFFYVIVDDGTGDPSDALLTAASVAVDAHRAEGIEAAVYPPTRVFVDVSTTVGLASGITGDQAVAVREAVRLALVSYLNTRPLGEDLAFDRLYQVIYDAAPGQVVKVFSLLANGSGADVVTALSEVIKAGTVSVA